MYQEESNKNKYIAKNLLDEQSALQQASSPVQTDDEARMLAQLLDKVTQEIFIEDVAKKHVLYRQQVSDDEATCLLVANNQLEHDTLMIEVSEV